MMHRTHILQLYVGQSNDLITAHNVATILLTHKRGRVHCNVVREDVTCEIKKKKKKISFPQKNKIRTMNEVIIIYDTHLFMSLLTHVNICCST